MWLDRVSNPGPPALESDTLPTVRNRARLSFKVISNKYNISVLHSVCHSFAGEMTNRADPDHSAAAGQSDQSPHHCSHMPALIIGFYL